MRTWGPAPTHELSPQLSAQPSCTLSAPSHSHHHALNHTLPPNPSPLQRLLPHPRTSIYEKISPIHTIVIAQTAWQHTTARASSSRPSGHRARPRPTPHTGAPTRLTASQTPHKNGLPQVPRREAQRQIRSRGRRSCGSQRPTLRALSLQSPIHAERVCRAAGGLDDQAARASSRAHLQLRVSACPGYEL